MKIIRVMTGLLGLGLLVGCAIVPLEPCGVYPYHGGYYRYGYHGGYGHHRPDHYGHGYYGKPYRGWPGYWR